MAHEETAISTIGMEKSEWLLARQKQGIGASEVGAMMGLSPYRTPFDVWFEKVSPEPIEIADNGPMKRGRMLEEIVAKMYADESGRVVENDDKIRIHTTCEYVFASLDRVITDNEDGNGPGVLECKTVTAQAAKSWDAEIPTVYFLQVQQQLAVTGWTWGVIAVLNVDTWKLTTIRFERDEKIIATIISEIEVFWTAYVVPEIEPPMVAADFSKVFRTDELPITATDEIKNLVSACIEASAKEKEAKAVADNLKAQLKEFYGENNILLDTDGKTVLGTWKTQSKKSYTVKESTSRVLRFKSSKED